MHVLYRIISRTFSTSTWSYFHLKRVPVLVRWKWPLEWVPSWQMARKFPTEKAWKWRISSQLCLFVRVSKIESMHRICSKGFLALGVLQVVSKVDFPAKKHLQHENVWNINKWSNNRTWNILKQYFLSMINHTFSYCAAQCLMKQRIHLFSLDSAHFFGFFFRLQMHRPCWTADLRATTKKPSLKDP